MENDSIDQSEVSKHARLVEVPGIPFREPHVWRIRSDHFPASSYIIESDSALRILLEPWIVGAQLAYLARSSSVDFLRTAFAVSREFRDSNLENITEVVPLAGALYYNVAEAFEQVFGETVSTCFIGAKRHLTPSGWVTGLAYENFEAMPAKPVILIGDTIATGGTSESIIQSVLDHRGDAKAVIVYAIAGGVRGAVRLKSLADRVDVPFYLFYSNAAFGVEDNGTDMPWLHPGTICSPEVRNRAIEAYGPELGRRWCSVWDWGDRAKNPVRHLEQLRARCERELAAGVSGNTRRILDKVTEETARALDRIRRPLSPVA